MSLAGWVLGVAPLAARYVWTAGLVAALAVVATVAWIAGPRLKRHVDQETAEILQSLAVTAAGAVAVAVLVDVWGLTDDASRAFLFTIDETDVVRLLVTLLVLAVAYTLTRVAKRFVRHGSSQRALTRHQREVTHYVVQVTVIVVTGLSVLAFWGVEPGNLLIGAGAFGLIVGLAARQTLGAVLAGFVLLGSRPFQVGDWVVVDDQEGIVTDISIVNTTLRTFDDEQVMIPNDRITDDHVVNRSRSGRLRVRVSVGVDYDADVGRAVEVATEAMESVDEVMDAPRPDTVVEQFGDSAVVLELRFWIENPSVQRKWAAQSAVVESVKTAFEEAGIDIPFPQRALSGRDEAIPTAADGQAATTDGGG
ncbi:MAG: mechanosensitive ion channel family protein [Haloarculaceae archaeon]